MSVSLMNPIRNCAFSGSEAAPAADAPDDGVGAGLPQAASHRPREVMAVAVTLRLQRARWWSAG
jgi:hypothetical protein